MKLQPVIRRTCCPRVLVGDLRQLPERVGRVRGGSAIVVRRGVRG